MQLVLLGTGDAWMEAALRGLAMSYPGWAVGIAEFQVSLRVCTLWETNTEIYTHGCRS
jgi:glycogen synthase